MTVYLQQLIRNKAEGSWRYVKEVPLIDKTGCMKGYFYSKKDACKGLDLWVESRGVYEILS